jgi:hypothetical protein
VTPPSEWSAPNWEANTQEALALRERLGALTGSALMQGAEAGTATVTVDLAALTTAYEAGTPSLKSAASARFDGVIADAFEEFLAAVAAGAQDLVSAGGDWQPGAEGGIWSTSNRAFNEGGIEVRQIVDKGLFGGALYNYALGLTTATIDEATIDRLAAAFGANPALNPGRNDDAIVENRNTHSANYIYRMGFFDEAKQALIRAKAFAAGATRQSRPFSGLGSRAFLRGSSSTPMRALPRSPRRWMTRVLREASTSRPRGSDLRWAFWGLRIRQVDR